MSELKARTAYSIAMEEEYLEYSGTTLVYLKSEADKVIAEKDAEIAGLKEERRWRKFSEEKPTEEMEGMDFIVSNGFFHREISEWRGYWNNDPFCGDRYCDEVKYWRPLPLEPKEE